ncbi:embryonic protein UVS.2-like [Mercenaria mercenaria]|uniref:embryonic protein UVS.2-like n=1 Tax=Mercenaria mercenaria TaxID=6596 RepID=UPI00234F5926|nr:embryonic protein UVS.2-like [Mercenaria mercenaria]
MCNDDFRLVSFIATSGNVLLKSLEQYSNKDLVCATFKTEADVLLNNVNASCSSSKILSALTSSFGISFMNGHYPELDISHCAAGNVAQSDSIMSQGSRKKRNAVAIKDWLWKDQKIPYVVDESEFDTVGVLMISKAIKKFNEDVACIKFTPRVNEFDYVRFKSGQGCHSTIGRDGGEQILTIGPDCYYLGVILHEMTHAVGFFHEQNRWDRDNYVTIFWNNIQTGKDHDFNLQDQKYLDTLGAPYDYGSIMHYGPYIFSKDPSKPTMTPKYDPHVELGQRDGFSKLDIWKINTLYGCKSGAPPLPDWMLYLSSTLQPTSMVATSSTSVVTSSTSSVKPGIPGKPKVLVTVFANALRINWDQPISTDQITGYLLSYKLEPNGRLQQVRVTANKLAYYLSTYTNHPGRRFTITIAAITDKGVGPESDPVTTRSACSKTLFLDNETFDKIHSPFFKHGYYEQDVVCQWEIRTPPRQHINLTFTALNISGTNECSDDYIRIGSSRRYCNTSPTNGDIIMATNDVKVTFVSKPGSADTKPGGFSMTASAQGYSPINLNIDEMIAGFNISWQSPLQTPSAMTSYVISYKLTSDAVHKEIDVSPETRYFLLSTYPHFGREYSIEIYAKYPSGNSQSAGPVILRSKCLRNITVSGTHEHLNSPHYPGKYEPGTICEWNVLPTSGRRLVLHFERIDLNNGDYVDILSEGTYLRLDAQNKPAGQIVTDFAKVQFVSDDNDEATGFRINFSLTSF